ncbi:MAG: hypothetical protein OEU26_29150, partial [Candidatus Tectomicrobia bacterium]|nr:hypothetical protein [Candidatus Tectomicrobia bacterium]
LLRDRAALAERIYERLRATGLTYQLELLGLDDDEQPIRSPAQVVGSVDQPGEGTCLDLALVYAGACLDRNLLPLVVVFSDHALTMVAIHHDRRDVDGYRPEDAILVNGVATDGDAVRQLVTGSKSHLAIECTGFAASSTLPGRESDGCLSFGDAMIAGAAAFDERTFRFAIDPFWLHRRGIKPSQREPNLSHPTERAVVSTKRTEVLVYAVTKFSPAFLESASPEELQELRQALDEVAKTYDSVRDVTKRWISAAVGAGGGLDSDLLANLVSGNLEADIHAGRGSCGEISVIYCRSLYDLIERAIADPDERGRVHEAFQILSYADYDMFSAFEEAGAYLQHEASEMAKLQAAGKTEAAQHRLASNYAEVARFQRAINESRQLLRDVQRQLVGT